MKRIILFLSFLFFFLNIVSQNNQLEDYLNRGLISYFNKIKENQEKGIVDSSFFDDLYLSVDNFPPGYSFENKIEIKYISLKNNKGYEKELKKGIWVILLKKVELKNNQLIIVYTLNKATLKNKKQLSMELSDSVSCIYEYSCNENKWMLINEKYSGV
ncbi:MAG: hypothetical protein QM654_18135 [Dysgonamonadaceae bacterium]